MYVPWRHLHILRQLDFCWTECTMEDSAASTTVHHCDKTEERKQHTKFKIRYAVPKSVYTFKSVLIPPYELGGAIM